MRIDNWTISKSTMFNSCPKSFLFERNTGHESGYNRKIIQLSTVVGIAVHEAIANQIGRWSSGMELDETEARKKADDIISRIWAERNHQIIEIMNGLMIEDRMMNRMRIFSETLLHNFFRMLWPYFGLHKYIMHEHLDSFTVEGICISCKTDLVTRDRSGMLVISDWKTTRSIDIDKENLQLNVYAIWGSDHFGDDVEKIKTQTVNLRTGEINQHLPTKQSIEIVKQKILLETERMKDSNEATFEAIPTIEKCYSCRFLNKCGEGKKSIEYSANQTYALNVIDGD